MNERQNKENAAGNESKDNQNNKMKENLESLDLTIPEQTDDKRKLAKSQIKG